MIHFSIIDLWCLFVEHMAIICMIQKIDLPVSVVLVFDHKKRLTKPAKVLYEGREHAIEKVDFHHTYRDGRTLYHVFSANSSSMFFRLVLNTDTLNWRCEEVDDGETN